MGKDLISECMWIRHSFVQFLDGGKEVLDIFLSAHPEHKVILEGNLMAGKPAVQSLAWQSTLEEGCPK
jgi:hypothetical protein